jgi:chemotaxis protein CheC
MTIEQVTSLTELEGDALGEIANIAMARAATSARQMLVPAVEILSKEAAAQIVGTPDNRILVVVRQDFTGAFSGRALSSELMRAVAGRSLSLRRLLQDGLDGPDCEHSDRVMTVCNYSDISIT